MITVARERLEKNEILFCEWSERPWCVVRPLSDYKLSPSMCIHVFCVSISLAWNNTIIRATFMAVCHSYRYDRYRTPKEVVWLRFAIRPAELTFIDSFIHKKQSSEGIVSSESSKKEVSLIHFLLVQRLLTSCIVLHDTTDLPQSTLVLSHLVRSVGKVRYKIQRCREYADIIWLLV